MGTWAAISGDELWSLAMHTKDQGSITTSSNTAVTTHIHVATEMYLSAA